MENVKKTMAMAMVTVALGATLIAGGSFAIFTSTAENTNNSFATGTLKINLNKEGSSDKFFNITNMAPGDSSIQKVKVTNSGTLDLRYDLVLSVGGDLGEKLVITAYDDSKATDPLEYSNRVLNSGVSQNIYVKVELPWNTDNAYQGKWGTASIRVDAEQTKNN
jgi:predicted ribosomally synthesized peptide with SipW-like signal peptide